MLTVVLHFVFSALPVGRSSPSRCPNHGLSLVLQSGTQDGRLGSLFSLEHFAGLDDRSLSCELNVLRRASSEVSSIAAAPVVSLKWPSHLNMHSLPWFCCLELLDSSRFFHLGELYVRKIVHLMGPSVTLDPHIIWGTLTSVPRLVSLTGVSRSA